MASRPLTKLVVVSVAIAVLALPALAPAGDRASAQINIRVRFLELDRNTFMSFPATLVHRFADGDSVNTAHYVVRSRTRLDDDFRVRLNRVSGRCSQEQASSATAREVRSQCRDAVLAMGTARFRDPRGDVFTKIVTVLREQGSRRNLIAHLFNRESGPITAPGSFVPSAPGRDFGSTLDLQLPPVGQLTELKTKFRGGRNTRQLLEGRCKDRNRKLNVSTTFTYLNGSEETAAASRNCKRS